MLKFLRYSFSNFRIPQKNQIFTIRIRAKEVVRINININTICVHGFHIHGLNQIQLIQKANCTIPLYIEDLNILGFWCPKKSWNQTPMNSKGRLYFTQTIGRTVNLYKFHYIWYPSNDQSPHISWIQCESLSG